MNESDFGSGSENFGGCFEKQQSKRQRKRKRKLAF